MMQGFPNQNKQYRITFDPAFGLGFFFAQNLGTGVISVSEGERVVVESCVVGCWGV